jgi:hypothetical protein
MSTVAQIGRSRSSPGMRYQPWYSQSTHGARFGLSSGATMPSPVGGLVAHLRMEQSHPGGPFASSAGICSHSCWRLSISSSLRYFRRIRTLYGTSDMSVSTDVHTKGIATSSQLRMSWRLRFLIVSRYE